MKEFLTSKDCTEINNLFFLVYENNILVLYKNVQTQQIFTPTIYQFCCFFSIFIFVRYRLSSLVVVSFNFFNDQTIKNFKRFFCLKNQIKMRYEKFIVYLTYKKSCMLNL